MDPEVALKLKRKQQMLGAVSEKTQAARTETDPSNWPQQLQDQYYHIRQSVKAVDVKTGEE